MRVMENAVMERKIINVTGKRQVTIPLKFYEQLSFGKEVECLLTEDAILLRPLSHSDDNFTSLHEPSARYFFALRQTLSCRISFHIHASNSI